MFCDSKILLKSEHCNITRPELKMEIISVNRCSKKCPEDSRGKAADVAECLVECAVQLFQTRVVSYIS